jgi:hypothetical protein
MERHENFILMMDIAEYGFKITEGLVPEICDRDVTRHFMEVPIGTPLSRGFKSMAAQFADFVTGFNQQLTTG